MAKAPALKPREAEKIDSADESLARAAVRQVVGSGLLDRHLAPGRPGVHKGDLPIAYLEREHVDELVSETRLVRMTQQTASKQRSKHKDTTAGDYRTLLPEVLAPRNAQLVLRQRGHWGHDTDDLVLFYFKGKKIYKAVIRPEERRRVLLSSFYESSRRDVEYVMKSRGVRILRDTRR